MRKKYEDPTFDIVKLHLTDALLTPSQFGPEEFVPEETICEDIIDDQP